MSSRIAEYKQLFRLLSRAKSSKEIEQLLHVTSKEFWHILSEICLNICNGNIPLPESGLKKLKKHKQTLRYLKNRRVSVKKKKEKLLAGSGLGFLFPMIFPLVSSLLSS